MNYKTAKYILIFLMSIFFLVPGLRAEGEKNSGKNPGLAKTNAQIALTSLNINNLSSYFFNNGISDISNLGNSGLYYPKGSGKTAVFTSGLLWGARVAGDPDPRMGGTAYRTGLVPGKVLADGTADDPTLDKYRIYRVRRDVYPGGPTKDLSVEADLDGFSESEIRANYEKDWTEWPVDMGAPFEDVDGNGVYDPTVDIPGFPGADQTLWFVTNDLNAGQTRFLYGANPLGIECQVTIWAYNQAGALGNMYFRKYKLINVTNRPALVPTTFEEMYFSMWSDVDLGDAGDDFVGVDVDKSLQYCYNAGPVDATYAPLPPPAVGFDFFQGPVVDGVAGEDINENGIDDAEDFGIFDGKRVGPGKINLPMTAAYYFANGDPTIGDPPQGNIEGSRQFYNFIRGRFGISGAIFTDLATGLPTTYALNGDPVTRTGWLDGIQLPPGDRRQGSGSGPFNMAPGDTQEVVVAEIVAGALPGMDNISAISLLRFYDRTAQNAYDNFFNLPVAPPAPDVKVTELDQKVVLSWGENLERVNATESYNDKGYTFQGYNVYQLPSASADVTAGKRLATYDIIDNVKRIIEDDFNPATAVILPSVKQFGEDTGIKRFIEITKDEFDGGRPLVNGKRYYFAVTSYSYSPDPAKVPNNVENPINIITVVPQSPVPGLTYGHESGEGLEVTHQGTADGSFSAVVVNPASTLGHDYEVFFTQRQEIRNANGDWVAASEEKLNKPGDLTGTSISVAGLYGPNPAAGVQLDFLLDLVSPTNAWADGITLTFPAGVQILNAPTFDAGGGSVSPNVNGNVVTMGLTGGELTQNGIFHGGEHWTIFISQPDLPFSIDWIVHDDGYTDPAGPVVDATGTLVIEEIGSLSRTANYWNLRDVTTGQLKLENMGVIGGVDLFPKRDDQVTTDYTNQANPIIDGVQVGLNAGSYEAPIDIATGGSISLERGPGSNTVLEYNTGAGVANNIQFSDYTVFSGTVTSFAIDNFGFGTTSVNDLQQDYELRFTGVWDTTVVNGQTIISIKPGTGSMATLFSGLNANSLPQHPLNPNPGSSTPFMVPIPFEVWNKDRNEQVNLMMRDRLQTPTAEPFYSYNPTNRMYPIIVDTPYDPTNPLVAGDPRRDKATWVFVTWSCNYDLGDVVTLQYNNPIQVGVDKYLYSTTAPSFSLDVAKSQVDEINVFPNPYYGVNAEELNKYNRFVTFSHLPAKAKVRIFNLAGVLVRTLDKDDPGQFMRWDLQNQSGLPVASGLYIAYVELPELGATKVLKIAVIQEQQILDRF